MTGGFYESSIKDGKGNGMKDKDPAEKGFRRLGV